MGAINKHNASNTSFADRVAQQRTLTDQLDGVGLSRDFMEDEHESIIEGLSESRRIAEKAMDAHNSEKIQPQSVEEIEKGKYSNVFGSV